MAPNVPCASCHHHILPLWAFSVARQHGVAVNEELYRKVAVKTYAFLQEEDRAIQGTRFVDPAVEGGSLLGLAKTAGVRSGFSTVLHTARLARQQREDGQFASFDMRPPSSGSKFMATAVAARAIVNELPVNMRGNTVEKAREWLLANAPLSTEDAAYRLLGLSWTGATPKQMQQAAGALAAMQVASSGGWRQGPARAEADAYATGEAVYALQATGFGEKYAGQIAQGLRFLLQTQAADGTWLVKTRIHEVAPVSPPYMETGFPYGKDQIISMSGTTWALMALAMSLPEAKGVKTPVVEEINPQVPQWMVDVAFGTLDDVRKVDLNLVSAKGSTPLMIAAMDARKTAILLERGADVQAKAKSGQTALTVAGSWKGSAEVMRMLAAKGAKVDPKAEGVEFRANPLIYAAYSNDVEAVRALLDAGASYQQPMLLQGLVPMSPMLAAIATGSTDVLREFLKRGADANGMDGGIPMLSLAAIVDRPESAKVLLEAGADPSRKDRFEWTPMQHARGMERDTQTIENVLRGPQAAR
ncbi:hypothetical protein F183_A51560 [Bryobacterales bacterium F-183]|nr:hypothetical protein F183_A51560 [Bryobacterales bacterium F-183]